jgi:DNA-binding HxlR family transcriptional regulator
MTGYGQFCPVAKAAEIVAERWTPLVLRELLCGSRRFNDLHRGLPLMSRTLLAKRLEQLEDAGIVRSVPRPRGRGREYHLTAAGEELRPLVERLGEWGQRWARAQVERGDLDPGLLMWARLLDETVRLVDALPERDGPPGAWEHPFFGPLGPRELIAYHRLHVMDHVRQIEAIKAAPGYPGPGSP